MPRDGKGKGGGRKSEKAAPSRKKTTLLRDTRRERRFSRPQGDIRADGGTVNKS